MTNEELHIWQTLTKSSDRAIQTEAYSVLGALQESRSRDGYYDGTWKEKQRIKRIKLFGDNSNPGTE